MNFDYVSGDYSAGISYKEVQPQDDVAEGETGTMDIECWILMPLKLMT